VTSSMTSPIDAPWALSFRVPSGQELPKSLSFRDSIKVADKQTQRETHTHIQCESKKYPPLRLSEFFHFIHKRLRIFTHLLHVLMYARLQIFIQLSPTLTKLCHIKRDYLVHIICTKCPKRAKMRAFRRLHKSLIALLIVVCGKSL